MSGPILLILALEQGPEFAAQAAHGTLLAVLAILVFSDRLRLGLAAPLWPDCLFIAAAAMLAVLGLRYVGSTLTVASSVIAALVLVPVVFPECASDGPRRPAAVMICTLASISALLLVLWSASALVLGPRWSGLLAMFR